MKKLKLLAFVFVGLSIAIVSCSKNGSTGPAGATGATGAAGPDSVYHSAWIPLSTTLIVTSNNDSIYEQVITASVITQNILDSGLVLTYIQDGNGNIADVSDYSGSIDAYYNVGTITLDSYAGDLSGIGNVRYVVIPGTILTTNSVLKNLTKAQVKASTYSVISKALGISDTKTTN